MGPDYWYTIGKITQLLPSPTHKRQLFIFYRYGHAGPDVYPKNLFWKNVWEMDEAALDERRTKGKKLQLDVMSTYLAGHTGPKKSQAQFLKESQNLHGYGCHCSP